MQHLTQARGVMGIYAIVLAETGAAYIGSSSNIGARLNSHRSALRRGVHKTRRLQEAWTEHGEAAFGYVLIERVTDLAVLGTRESAWLEQSGSFIPGVGFNRSPSATGAGWQYSTQQKARLSAAHKGLTRSPSHCAALSAKKLSLADAQAARERGATLGRSGKGRSKSADHRRKIGDPQRGIGNHNATLTEQDVREIRRRLALPGNGTYGFKAKIARDFGISGTTVRNIETGASWGHLT